MKYHPNHKVLMRRIVLLKRPTGRFWVWSAWVLLGALIYTGLQAESPSATIPQGPPVLLPDGRPFVSWEQPLQFSRTYYVDNRNPQAADTNPGTSELPFLTINRAALVLRPGERVVIRTGVYRERVDPAYGGTAPDRMISYEAAPGADVVVKGSRLVKTGWEPSNGYNLDLDARARAKVKIYQRRLDDIEFHGYNPFGMVNMMQDRIYLNPTPAELRRHLLRRGMVFVDGQRLEQVEQYNELGHTEGSFWCEHDGLTIHVRLPRDADPARHEIELTVQEQVFAPRKLELSYIRVKGITFEHASSQFPGPQIGMVSASRGNHWIIEDCVMRHANSVALDIGAQDGGMVPLAVIGYSIVRRNHIDDVGVCGLAGLGVQDTLIDSNLIEHVGWQDVELTWEAGGIKLHVTRNCLLRRNVIRHLRHAMGIWLDYMNKNTRVTGNVIGDTLETLRGGIYIEASHFPNMFDNNIIWKATPGKGGSTANFPSHGGWGITIDGSDEIVMAHNLIGNTQDSAINIRTTEGRIVGTRGGTSRWNKVINNVLYHCGNGIQFSNRDNTAEGNFYSRPGNERGDENQSSGRGLNFLADGNANLRLDLEAWQKFFGFDKNGAYGDMNIDVDLDALTMTWSVTGPVPRVATEEQFKYDLLGESAGALRSPGPLLHVPEKPATVSIDPRAGAQ